ncbi:hypothetical protein OV203_50550 [Nannocystis sp. ILAH1]|uniref:hypothetical protein n=1 Tax=Nannocystis sp. ILAH1 TaxID=2996789 RepID=UPI002271B192|nr:hypothetical protein [Nannocystis sp. ILAH1]MCY0995467.1 hypothetical protein [Nannocystis sp. ILAH1]
MPLPLSLASQRQLGNYHGAFRSLAELGNCLRLAVGVTAGLTVAERVAITCDLHARGDIRVVEHENAVHVFGRPDSTADRVLASEGNYLDEPQAIDLPRHPAHQRKGQRHES